MSFYGYNPAEYKTDYSFISEATEKIGSAMSYIPELMDARNQIDNNQNLQTDLTQEVYGFADRYSNDEEFQTGFLQQSFDGVDQEEAVNRLIETGAMELPDGYNPRGTAGAANITKSDGATVDYNELFGQYLNSQLRNIIPTMTADGRRGRTQTMSSDGTVTTNRHGEVIDNAEFGKARSLSMSNEEFHNRVAQNMENMLLPIFRNTNNGVNQDIMYASQSVAEYGTDDSITSVRGSIEDRRQENNYQNFKEQVDAFETKPDVSNILPAEATAEGTAETNLIEGFGEIGMSGMAAQQLVKEQKLTHSAAEAFVANTQIQYDKDVTEYVGNYVDYLYEMRLAKAVAVGGIDVGNLATDFHNTDAMTTLQDQVWSGFNIKNEVSKLGLTGEMSPDAQRTLMEDIEKRETTRRAVSTSMFQRRTPTVPAGGGGGRGLSAADNPHRYRITAATKTVDLLQADLTRLNASKNEASGTDQIASITRQITTVRDQLRTATAYLENESGYGATWQADINLGRGNGGFITNAEQVEVNNQTISRGLATLSDANLKESLTSAGVSSFDSLGELNGEQKSTLEGELSTSFKTPVTIVGVTQEMIDNPANGLEGVPVDSIVLKSVTTTANGTQTPMYRVIPRALLDTDINLPLDGFGYQKPEDATQLTRALANQAVVSIAQASRNSGSGTLPSAQAVYDGLDEQFPTSINNITVDDVQGMLRTVSENSSDIPTFAGVTMTNDGNFILDNDAETLRTVIQSDDFRRKFLVRGRMRASTAEIRRYLDEKGIEASPLADAVISEIKSDVSDEKFSTELKNIGDVMMEPISFMGDVFKRFFFGDDYDYLQPSSVSNNVSVPETGGQ